MKAKQPFMIFVLFVILPRGISKHVEKARKKSMLGENSFSFDINRCFFQFWTPFVGTNKEHAGLEKRVECRGTQLCYGGNKKMAQFAVCYNQKTLIPEFTGHIVYPVVIGQGNEGNFREDTTIDPVATDADYAKTQMGLYFNYNLVKNKFFARGHLTPNADFSTYAERAMTMVTTNIAPQWQLFNGGNWQKLEQAIRGYATQTTNPLYVFTGTGGVATNRQGYSIKLNGRVQVPKYYWKAICDPFEKLSVIFWGENTIGDAQGDEGQVESCCGKLQKKLYGVICCSSLNEAKRDYRGIFQIPEFHIKNCVPSLLGNKLKDFIVNRLQ